MRIAIVGSGISGLVAARSLCREHRVTVMEAAASIGGSAATLDVKVDGVPASVDVSPLLHLPGGGLAALFHDLGIDTAPVPMGYSVRHESLGVEFSGPAFGSVTPPPLTWLRPGVRRMVRDMARFGREVRDWLTPTPIPTPPLPTPQPLPPDTTLEVFLTRGGRGGGGGVGGAAYSAEFAHWYLLPALGALWGCGEHDALAMPIGLVLRALADGGFLGDAKPWHAPIGARSLLRVLEPWLENHGVSLRTRCPVRWVRGSTGSHRYREERREGDVEIVSDAGTERFDAVILATPADAALAILGDPTPAEHDLLGAFEYRSNQLVVHTDDRVMPRRRANWSPWNLHPHPPHRPHRHEDGDLPARVTCDATLLHGQDAPAGKHLFITANNPAAIDPACALRLVRRDRPVLSPLSLVAQARHGEISGPSRRFYAGSYWRYGFHEDASWSGQRAADQLQRWTDRRP